MITFMPQSKEEPKETEHCLDSQLWHACAGSMVEMPIVNSKVFYFPQGHLEHVSGNLDFRNCPRFPSYVPCIVSSIQFMADPDTDEVFARIRLVPINRDEFDSDIITGAIEGISSENQDKPSSFAKTLTQSDANNGGGFSVPRYCAETIFPRLDFSADPPVQTILAKDVHGEIWKFRHIYRGTPRRHLLTTGWSSFVNHKKLVAGDSIVFLRAENGDLCVGIRRAKKGIVGGWNPAAVNGNGSLIGRGRVKTESVIEAATLAASGKPFDVVYYPRASTPEFCVKASLVNAAMKMRWCSGMRFKMAFETEDSSRISWFMGTISSVQVADRARWPDSPWKLLQVRWDEPDLLQNVKRVNPWLVELVSTMPPIHLSPFSPPHKKMKLPQYPSFALSNDPFACLNDDNAPAGMQGARHSAQYGLSSLSSLHLTKLPSGFFPISYPASKPVITPEPSRSDDDVSCHLTIGIGTSVLEESENRKVAPFLLFGQPIFTEKQISLSCSSDTVSNADKIGNASDGSGSTLYRNDGSGSGSESELGLGTGHCKAFLESELTWS